MCLSFLVGDCMAEDVGISVELLCNWLHEVLLENFWIILVSRNLWIDMIALFVSPIDS